MPVNFEVRRVEGSGTFWAASEISFPKPFNNYSYSTP